MPPTQTAETRKDALLEVAARLFYAQGYHATGIKQIIESAGIAKGTFYSHFKSKEEIGTAWLRHRHHEWNAMLEEALAPLAGSPRAQLLGVFDFLEEWMKTCDFRGCAFLNSLGELPSPDGPMRAEIRAHKRDLLARLRQLVDAHFTGHSEEAREHIAANLFIAIEGAVVETQNFCDPWPIATARHQLEAIL